MIFLPRLRRLSALTATATVLAGAIVASGGATAWALDGVTPILICVSYDRTSGYETARFGYDNRNADDVGQTALHLSMADEDPAGATDDPVNEARLLQRRQHLPKAGPAGAVALREVTFAAQLGAGFARVDVRNDSTP